jgi:hypothetical protein
MALSTITDKLDAFFLPPAALPLGTMYFAATKHGQTAGADTMSLSCSQTLQAMFTITCL